MVFCTSFGFSQLIDNDDGTVTDVSTGLMWTKDANLGVTLYENSWIGNGWFSDYSATNWVEGLEFAGYSDWRLSVITHSGYGPSEIENLFRVSLNNQENMPPTNFGPFVNVLMESEFGYVDGNGEWVNVINEHSTYWNEQNIQGEFTININDYSYYNHFMVDGATASVWPVRSTENDQVIGPCIKVERVIGTIAPITLNIKYLGYGNQNCTLTQVHLELGEGNTMSMESNSDGHTWEGDGTNSITISFNPPLMPNENAAFSISDNFGDYLTRQLQ